MIETVEMISTKQTIWDEAKVVLNKKFIALNAYIRKKKLVN